MVAQELTTVESIGSFPEHPTLTPLNCQFAKYVNFAYTLKNDQISFLFKSFSIIQIQSGNNEIDYQKSGYNGVQYLDGSPIQ